MYCFSNEIVEIIVHQGTAAKVYQMDLISHMRNMLILAKGSCFNGDNEVELGQISVPDMTLRRAFISMTNFTVLKLNASHRWPLQSNSLSRSTMRVCNALGGNVGSSYIRITSTLMGEPKWQ